MKRFRNLWLHYQLPGVVFLTGAAVLIVEVVATRILSPYFGNTLYTVSSVLGVVLAALSVGYYVGGRLADRRPEHSVFFTIILCGGISVLCLQIFSKIWLPGAGYQLSIVYGPLVSSTLLFFLPGFLLGMLSPFAIKLQEKQLPQTGIGTIAGEMFFWSTLGSIAGSLSAGFIWVPFVGIDATVIGVGVFLCLLGFVPLIVHRRNSKFVSKLGLIGLILAAAATSIALVRPQNIVHSADGLYEKLTIFDTTQNGQPVRHFQQDRSSSSAMYLNSDELVFDYTKYYELYKGVKPSAARSLVIGGAAYSIPKALLAESPEMKVDVAEIEPSLEKLGKQYFRVPETDRLQTHLIDGRRWLVTSDNTYDLIFSDVYYSLYSIPAHFTTKEFFETAKRQLSQNGMFIANLIGDLSPEPPSFAYSELKTFKSVFPNHYLFAVGSPETEGSQNLILVGINGEAQLNFTANVFAQSKNEVLRSLAEKHVLTKELKLEAHSMLTDNHAPVEYMMSHQLRKNKL